MNGYKTKEKFLLKSLEKKECLGRVVKDAR